MERNGFPEETYYTFSYSPIPDSDGSPGGIFCANTDDTQRVIGERQLSLLRELASNAAQSRTVQEACELSAKALGTDARDLPFAMIYLVDQYTGTLRLAALSGIGRDHAAANDVLSLETDAPWPLDQVVATQKVVHISDLGTRFSTAFPDGGWRVPPGQAIVAPLMSSGELAGVLIAGLNPFRLSDGKYASFLELAAGQIASAVNNANAYEEERRRAEALAEVDRAKTTFFSNVSHEFRTPLTLMLGPLEDAIAKADGLPVEHRTALNRRASQRRAAVEAGQHAARLRPHRGGPGPGDFQPADLGALTAELASSFRSAIDKAGLQLAIDARPLPQPVYVDRDMWEKIVLNLLSNAFKFTFDGEIGISRQAFGRRRACRNRRPRHRHRAFPPRSFRICSNGSIGSKARKDASSKAAASAWHWFRNSSGCMAARSGESKPGQRHDLHGLAAVRHRAPSCRPSRCRRRAGSRPIRGRRPMSTKRCAGFQGEVSDDLPPASSAEDIGLPFAGARGPRNTGSCSPTTTPTCATTFAACSAMLYEVEAVGRRRGRRLQAAVAHRPDLVLTRRHDAEAGRLRLAAALRDDPDLRDMPVIFLSARAGEEAKIEGLRRGADDYLVKPFSARELLARVAANLELSGNRAGRRARSVKEETAGLELLNRSAARWRPSSISTAPCRSSPMRRPS